MTRRQAELSSTLSSIIERRIGPLTRRREERLEISSEVSILVSIQNPKLKGFLQVALSDLSMTGAKVRLLDESQFESYDLLKEGDVLVLGNFALKSILLSNIKSTIVSKSKRGSNFLHLKLDTLTDNDKIAIRVYLKNLKKSREASELDSDEEGTGHHWVGSPLTRSALLKDRN